MSTCLRFLAPLFLSRRLEGGFTPKYLVAADRSNDRSVVSPSGMMSFGHFGAIGGDRFGFVTDRLRSCGRFRPGRPPNPASGDSPASVGDGLEVRLFAVAVHLRTRQTGAVPWRSMRDGAGGIPLSVEKKALWRYWLPGLGRDDEFGRTFRSCGFGHGRACLPRPPARLPHLHASYSRCAGSARDCGCCRRS